MSALTIRWMTGCAEPGDTESHASPASPAAPLLQVLEELHGVLGDLTDDEYARKPGALVTSSIGAHVRHCLDHVQALLGAAETEVLDYEQRARGSDVETNRRTAIEMIGSLRERIGRLPGFAFRRPVVVSMMLTSDGEPVRLLSTLGRETAYVLSHTIHHNALIGTIVKLLGGRLPERFGYAPSTIAHQKQLQCAR